MITRIFSLGIVFISVLLAVVVSLPVRASEQLGGVESRLGASVGTPSQMPGQRIQLLGELTGYVYAVAVRGHYAFLGQGHRLVAVDVSDPARPQLISQSPRLPELIEAIALQGNHVYVADGSGGLQVIDASDPLSLRVVDWIDLGGAAHAVTVVDGYVFVATSDGLVVVDVSQPADPRHVAFVRMSSSALSVAVVGGNAYVAAGDLWVVDVSNPTAPRAVSVYRGSYRAQDVAAAGHFAYLAAGSGGLRVVDVSSPALPTEVGFLRIERQDVGSITLAAGYGYLTAYRGGLHVLDLSSPAKPTVVGSYPRPSLVFSTGDPSYLRVAVADGRAYVAQRDHGLGVLDVSNPARPTPIGSFFALPYGGWTSARIAVEGDATFLAMGKSLDIFDTSNPASPRLISTYQLPDFMYGLKVANNYAYVTTYTKGLRIIAVSDRTNPSEVAAFVPVGSARGLEIVGDRAYLSTWADCSRGPCVGGGLYVVDISNPISPTQVGGTAPPYTGGAIAVAGRHAYIAAGDLYIVDVSDPANPSEVGVYRKPQNTDAIYGIMVAAGYAYIAQGRSGLRVLDVSDPAHPVEIDSLGSYPWDFIVAAKVVGDRVYVASMMSPGWGLQILDISHPSSPILVGTYQLSAGALDVAVAGGRIYVANGSNAYGGGGISILRYTGYQSFLPLIPIR